MLLAFNNYLKPYDYKTSLSVMNWMKMSSQKQMIMQYWFPKPENNDSQILVLPVSSATLGQQPEDSKTIHIIKIMAKLSVLVYI